MCRPLLPFSCGALVIKSGCPSAVTSAKMSVDPSRPCSTSPRSMRAVVGSRLARLTSPRSDGSDAALMSAILPMRVAPAPGTPNATNSPPATPPLAPAMVVATDAPIRPRGSSPKIEKMAAEVLNGLGSAASWLASAKPKTRPTISHSWLHRRLWREYGAPTRSRGGAEGASPAETATDAPNHPAPNSAALAFPERSRSATPGASTSSTAPATRAVVAARASTRPSQSFACGQPRSRSEWPSLVTSAAARAHPRPVKTFEVVSTIGAATCNPEPLEPRYTKTRP